MLHVLGCLLRICILYFCQNVPNNKISQIKLLWSSFQPLCYELEISQENFSWLCFDPRNLSKFSTLTLGYAVIYCSVLSIALSVALCGNIACTII